MSNRQDRRPARPRAAPSGAADAAACIPPITIISRGDPMSHRLDDLRQDLVHAIRGLRRSPALPGSRSSRWRSVSARTRRSQCAGRDDPATAAIRRAGSPDEAVGIYGVIMLAVVQRTREIAIRMALGAPGGRMVAMLLGEGEMFGGPWGRGRRRARGPRRARAGGAAVGDRCNGPSHVRVEPGGPRNDRVRGGVCSHAARRADTTRAGGEGRGVIAASNA